MKLSKRSTALVAASLALLLGAAAAQQDTADTAPAEPGSETGVEAVDDVAGQELPGSPAQPPAAQADEASAGPAAAGITDEMKASMRRFVPSEQISEDSAVSFPNDI